jgi:hypothetical protein
LKGIFTTILDKISKKSEFINLNKIYAIQDAPAAYAVMIFMGSE